MTKGDLKVHIQQQHSASTDATRRGAYREQIRDSQPTQRADACERQPNEEQIELPSIKECSAIVIHTSSKRIRNDMYAQTKLRF